jgi:hypothetical protein
MDSFMALFLFFLFSSTWVWTQGLVLHLGHTPDLFLLLFLDRVLLFGPRPASDSNRPLYLLSSWDYSCSPPYLTALSLHICSSVFNPGYFITKKCHDFTDQIFIQWWLLPIGHVDLRAQDVHLQCHRFAALSMSRRGCISLTSASWLTVILKAKEMMFFGLLHKI